MGVLNTDLRVLLGVPLDNKYMNNGVPYVNTAEVNSLIEVDYRHRGLTVNIQGVEYWYKDGTTNGDLVVKSADLSGYAQLNGATFTGYVESTSFIKTGGTDSQLLTADGSVTTVENGLTLDTTSQKIKLGGTVTDFTTLTGLPGSTLMLYDLPLTKIGKGIVSLSADFAIGTIGSKLQLDENGSILLRGQNSTLGLSDIQITHNSITIQKGGATSTLKSIYMDDSEFTINDEVGVGVKYALDYSQNWDNTATYDNVLVNKKYVDDLFLAGVQGLVIKESVRVATTTDLINTLYTPGSLPTEGLGATLESTVNEALVIDGITLSIGDRVLIKNQTTASQNGIYVVTDAGSVSTNWLLTRSTDFDGTPVSETQANSFTFVSEGTTLADTGWVLTTNNPIEIGTTFLDWSQFSGAGTITASNGLTKTGANIKLGGSLTEASTMISGTNEKLFAISSGLVGLFGNINISGAYSSGQTSGLNVNIHSVEGSSVGLQEFVVISGPDDGLNYKTISYHNENSYELRSTGDITIKNTDYADTHDNSFVQVGDGYLNVYSANSNDTSFGALNLIPGGVTLETEDGGFSIQSGDLSIYDNSNSIGVKYALDYSVNWDNTTTFDNVLVNKKYVDTQVTSSVSTSKYAETYAPTADTLYTLTHGLNDSDIIVTVWDTATNEQVYPQVVRTTGFLTTKLDITFVGSAPSSVRVIVKK